MRREIPNDKWKRNRLTRENTEIKKQQTSVDVLLLLRLVR